MTALALPPNQLHHFYKGGPAIAALRGVTAHDDQAPEDWVGSVTTRFGSATEGLSRLEDGRLLRDALRDDPAYFLGAAHVARYGPEPDLLVKLLDAGQRLPVHFHPGRAFAQAELGSDHGKTEAWIVIAAPAGGGAVHVGFREEVSEETVGRWLEEQDGPAMLDSLHALDVAPGDAIFVPAGTPHAIGVGLLIVELQEPTDFSVTLEWSGFDLDGGAEGHLGLGWETALRALDRSAWSGERLAGLRRDGGAHPPGREALLPDAADPYFRAERVRASAERPGVELDAGFSILVVLDGAGVLSSAAGGELVLRRGDTVLVPDADGLCRLRGEVELLRCRPPAAGPISAPS